MDEDCVFCRIVAGEEPAHVVYDGDGAMGFLDVNAAAEGHTLVVPRNHHRTLTDMDPAAAGRLFGAVTEVGEAIEAAFDPEGLSVFQSNGEAAGQDVFHVHVHVMPRWTDDGLGFAPSRRRLGTDEGDRIAGEIRAEL